MRNALKAHWPEYLMEATELAAFMISASVFTILLYHPASPAVRAIPAEIIRRVLTGLAMGLTLVGLVYSPWGKRSGAHMNPAFTLTFWRLGKVAPWDAAFYSLAQFVGGLGGILAVAAVAATSLAHPAVNYVATVPGPGGPRLAFLAEAAISFILLTVVLIFTNRPSIAPFTGIVAGLCVAAFITFESPFSGMSMNPARTFGSALLPHLWRTLWVYFTAPPLGMLLAAEVYVLLNCHVACAKYHHQNHFRCIFCEYQASRLSTPPNLSRNPNVNPNPDLNLNPDPNLNPNLIHTSLQQGGPATKGSLNRFSGFVLMPALLLFSPSKLNAENRPLTFQSQDEQTSLLELYTSEGCSSCPPAEKWLSGLKDSPRLWRDFVPVAFHVDYWDYLGWRDPWASKDFSDRQRAYAQLWRSRSIYTPGLVLDGKEWRNGSALRDGPPSSGAKTAALTVSSADLKHWQVGFAPIARLEGGYEVHAAALANGLTSDVKAGENRGRRLNHDFVVTALASTSLHPNRDRLQGQFTLDLTKKAQAGRLAIAVWVTRLGRLEPLQAVGGWLNSPR